MVVLKHISNTLEVDYDYIAQMMGYAMSYLTVILTSLISHYEWHY
jgi:hypothetical protein